MDNEDIQMVSLLFVVLLALSTLIGWGTYKYGRHKERAELTMALIAQSKDTFYDGYDQAMQECRKGNAQ